MAQHMSFDPSRCAKPLATVSVGTVGDEIFIHVQGAATHLAAQPLRECLSRLIDRGSRHFWLDLEHCSYMDSTFLGVLAAAGKRLRGTGNGRFAICHISPRNLELLETLGIDRFFQIETLAPPAEVAAAEAQTLPASPTNHQEWQKTMLDAHRTLIEADGRNGPKFKDVIRFLEEELGRPAQDRSRPGN